MFPLEPTNQIQHPLCHSIFRHKLNIFGPQVYLQINLQSIILININMRPLPWIKSNKDMFFQYFIQPGQNFQSFLLSLQYLDHWCIITRKFVFHSCDTDMRPLRWIKSKKDVFFQHLILPGQNIQSFSVSLPYLVYHHQDRCSHNDDLYFILTYGLKVRLGLVSILWWQDKNSLAFDVRLTIF